MNTCKKLREAAINIVKNENIFFGEDQTTSEEWEKIHSLLNALKAAVAEPPRNCDRFETKEDAAIAFANEKKQWIPQQVLWELAPWLDWLFTTAENRRDWKKGENDGSN